LFLARLLLLFELLLKCGNFLLYFPVFFLLANKLRDEVLAVGLLLLKFRLEYLIFLFEFSVLGLGSLRDIRDQLQVVLQLILALSFLRSFIATLCLFLLDRFFGPGDHALIASGEFFSLIVFERLELLFIIVNVLIDGIVDALNIFLIRIISVLLEALAHAQLPLQLTDLLPVLRLILHVSLRSARDLSLHLFVFLLHVLDFFLQVEVFVVPGHLLDLIFVLLFANDFLVKAFGQLVVRVATRAPS